MFGTRRSPMATPERLPCSTLSFHMFLRLLNLIIREGTPRPLVSYALCQGLIVFFHNLPMAEARDVHCCSHVVENLGKRTIPSDHAAVRFVIQKPTHRGHHTYSQLDVLQQLDDDHRFSLDPLAEFKVLLHRAKRITKRGLSKQTPDCIGAKLLITSTALRAY